jgi:hypothetical protein
VGGKFLGGGGKGRNHIWSEESKAKGRASVWKRGVLEAPPPSLGFHRLPSRHSPDTESARVPSSMENVNRQHAISDQSKMASVSTRFYPLEFRQTSLKRN